MDKKLLRTIYLQKRKNLTQAQVLEKNSAITKNALSFLKTNPVDHVHIFLAQVEKAEVDTWQVIAAFNSQFPLIQIAIPRVIPGTKEMEHYILTSQTQLIDNQWSIPEPDPETSIPIAEGDIDAVFIPLLAFDKKGFRVGYGGGYYDRFLAKCGPDVIKIGLSFFEAADGFIVTDPFDIAMDYCVTPAGIVRF
jgi:5-formyltetrahydrofolate cyclo-ligase